MTIQRGVTWDVLFDSVSRPERIETRSLISVMVESKSVNDLDYTIESTNDNPYDSDAVWTTIIAINIMKGGLQNHTINPAVLQSWLRTRITSGGLTTVDSGGGLKLTFEQELFIGITITKVPAPDIEMVAPVSNPLSHRTDLPFGRTVTATVAGIDLLFVYNIDGSILITNEATEVAYIAAGNSAHTLCRALKVSLYNKGGNNCVAVFNKTIAESTVDIASSLAVPIDSSGAINADASYDGYYSVYLRSVGGNTDVEIMCN